MTCVTQNDDRDPRARADTGVDVGSDQDEIAAVALDCGTVISISSLSQRAGSGALHLETTGFHLNPVMPSGSRITSHPASCEQTGGGG